ncbi:MAG: hypothetical protein RMI30_00825 [Thermodesulfovibrio sp.]|nr:hypothetical protein [Thermodesulfovibrio sp.]MDW7997987.1 hypothetical protein [Thermodesulfovibrio sp.]
MSTISKIFGNYKNSLDYSKKRYQELYIERVSNAQAFYKDFFYKLIKQYKPIFSNSGNLYRLKREILKFFEKEQIDFVAIDGTCSKEPFKDFIIFFGGAYGAKGSISIEGEPPKVRYQKWEINKDVSMVAYIPIPFAQLSDITDTDMEETFVVSDSDRIDLSNIQTSIMQLAEIFLAYNVVTSSVLESPKLLMLDLSPSSLMASVAIEPIQVHLAGCYPYDRRTIDMADIAIAFAHPFNLKLGIPGTKKFKRYSLIISKFHSNGSKPLDVYQLAKEYGLTIEDLGFSNGKISGAIKYVIDNKIADLKGGILRPLVDVEASWEYVKSFFQNLCRKLFIEKDQSALIYDSADERGIRRRRWLSPNDIKFLISVGIRALIEECWKRKILLTGVVKDSHSRYLSRNYLGVLKYLELYPELNELQVLQLPWTDRIFLETLPLCDENLEAPWSSIEIDSAFMTLFLYQQDPSKSPIISGVKGSIVFNEKLFARSLAQFFIKRNKATPLMGHVVFLDRLLYSEWDTDKLSLKIKNDEIGELSLFYCPYNNTPNIGQDIMLYFLSTLTRNHFPEVIGYPDPLHKADWGAKSIGKKVKELIKNSEISFRANPLSKTFRIIRDSLRRI